MSAYGMGAALVASASIDHSGIEDSVGAEVEGSIYVIGLTIPDMEELIRAHIEF